MLICTELHVCPQKSHDTLNATVVCGAMNTQKSPLEVPWSKPLFAAAWVQELAQRFVLDWNSQFDSCRGPVLE